MKKTFTVILGVLSVASLLVAQKMPLAEVPLAGVMKLSEMTWAGGGRLYLAAIAAFFAIVTALIPRFKAISVAFAALAFGIALDIAFSGWQWRVETFAMMESIGQQELEKSIQWKMGSVAFGVAEFFLLSLTVLLAFPERKCGAGSKE